MKDHKKLFIDNEIIEDGKNYAAIYARISSMKDNNSINAQIEQGKKVISQKELMLYAVYSDHTSARTTSPENRNGFSKLLTDAKKGYFKTLVIYRHDRLVRNLNHWLTIKNQLSKIGVSIVYSDTSEFVSDGSPEKDFLENLLVMVAELEPNNIEARTEHGKAFRRQQGILNSGANPPFGYLKKAVETKDISNKGRSYYEIEYLRSLFVIYLFNMYKSLVIIKKFDIKDLKKKVIIFLKNTISEINNKGSIQHFMKNPNYNKQQIDILINLNERLSLLTISDVLKELNYIKKHLDQINNWHFIFRRPIYGGLLLLDANDITNGIIKHDEKFKLNPKAFADFTNGNPIIEDSDLWKEVYCHYHNYTAREKKEPTFLFDNLLHCTCNKKLNLKNGLLQCDSFHINKTCKAYSKTNLIISILDLILDETLFKIYTNYESNNSAQGLQSFKQSITERVRVIDSEIIKYRKLKLKSTESLIKYNDTASIKDIHEYHKTINSLLYNASTLRNKLNVIEDLEDILRIAYSGSNSKTNHELKLIKQNLIIKIIKDQTKYMPIFNK